MKQKKDWFVFGNEHKFGLLIEDGGQKEWVKDAPAKHPDSGWNKKLCLGNGFRVAGDFSGLPAEEIEQLSESGRFFLMIDLFRCHKKTIDMIMALMKNGKYKDKIWGTLFGERDGSWYEWADSHPDYFPTRHEAAEYFKKWLCEQTPVWGDPNDPAGHKTWYFRDLKSALLPRKTFAAHVKTNRFPVWANMAAQSSALYVLHHYYEWGFKFVWLERSAWFSNVQLGIAFLRGAANQYQGYWGIDFSTWGGLTDLYLPTFYDNKSRRRAGAEEDFLFRGWLVSFLSGTNLAHEEVTEAGFFLPWEDKEKPPQLSPLGEKAKAFADFALKRHPDRGTPYVPFGLVLEHDHGWDAPGWAIEHFAWAGKVPYEKGDYMIENFFEEAFPGYKTSCGSYDKNWNPAVPWKDEKEYARMLKNGFDMRPFAKGKITGSRWGDSFDVLLENAPSEVLKKYKVITFLGRLKLTAALLSKFERYVKEGGTLIISGNQIADDMKQEQVKKLFGIKIISTYRESYGTVRCAICGREMGELRFSYTSVELKGAKALAINHHGESVITEHSVGRGKIVFVAAHYGQELRGLSFLNSTTHILDHIYNSNHLAQVEGNPIEYLVNIQEESIWVTMVNNEPSVWEGEISVDLPPRMKKGEVKEIWTEQPVKSVGKNTARVFRASIKPFSFGIFEMR